MIAAAEKAIEPALAVHWAHDWTVQLLSVARAG